MKSYTAITFLVIFYILQVSALPADPTDIAMRLDRLSMLPENRMRNNDLNDPAHESLYTAERYRYNEKLKAMPATALNEQEEATTSLIPDELTKNPKVEKNVRTLVSSMLGLMSGLLRSHLRDEQQPAQNN